MSASVEINYLNIVPNHDGSETRTEFISVFDIDLYHRTKGKQKFYQGGSKDFKLIVGCGKCRLLKDCKVTIVEGVPGRKITYELDETTELLPCFEAWKNTV